MSAEGALVKKVKKIAIAIAAAVAAIWYCHYCWQPSCHMCKDTMLIKCPTCYGKGIRTVRSVSVDPSKLPTTGRLGCRFPRGFGFRQPQKVQVSLDKPYKEICPDCKGTKLCGCLSCRPRITYKFNTDGVPVERTIRTRTGELVRTERIDPDDCATLP